MIKLKNNITKNYCRNCDKHGQEHLHDIDITDTFNNTLEVNGMCKECLLKLANIIQKEFDGENKNETL